MTVTKREYRFLFFFICLARGVCNWARLLTIAPLPFYSRLYLPTLNPLALIVNFLLPLQLQQSSRSELCRSYKHRCAECLGLLWVADEYRVSPSRNTTPPSGRGAVHYRMAIWRWMAIIVFSFQEFVGFVFENRKNTKLRAMPLEPVTKGSFVLLHNQAGYGLHKHELQINLRNPGCIVLHEHRTSPRPRHQSLGLRRP